jgi:hypothetical protein
MSRNVKRAVGDYRAAARRGPAFSVASNRFLASDFEETSSSAEGFDMTDASSPVQPLGMPAQEFGTGLNLSDFEYAWIGAVTAHWAFAEHVIDGIIALLGTFHKDGQGLAAKRSFNFIDKVDTAKKLIRLHFPEVTLEREVGIALLTRGKELSQSRKKFGHWIAGHGDSESVAFLDANFCEFKFERVNLSHAEIRSLAIEIKEWTSELISFVPLAFLQRYVSLRAKSGALKSSEAVLKWENFRTIQKIPRLSTGP